MGPGGDDVVAGALELFLDVFAAANGRSSLELDLADVRSSAAM
jgi:hypothetical protein